MPMPVNQTIKEVLTLRLSAIEQTLDSDVLCFYGPIVNGTESHVLTVIEDLAKCENKRKRLLIVLTTPGGSAETVERYVNVIRHHYDEVNFLIPDYAFSAGTIFCMSGDNIYMDYFSVLGPIDPQVRNKEGKFVGALGYLDKINELIEKAQKNALTQAEFLILKDFDLAELKGYEQAKELTIDLLKRWLVKYKFKNWSTHATNPALLGQPVTLAEKEARATEIATKLSDNNVWKSHGRPINLSRLQEELRMKIEDYSKDDDLRDKVRGYYTMLVDYCQKNSLQTFIHTRRFF